jgi:hypothetical protein
MGRLLNIGFWRIADELQPGRAKLTYAQAQRRHLVMPAKADVQHVPVLTIANGIGYSIARILKLFVRAREARPECRAMTGGADGLNFRAFAHA